MEVEATTQQALTDEAIRKALDWAQAAEGFVVEQAPLVVQEIVAYGRILTTTKLTMAVVALVVSCVLIGRGIRAIPKLSWTSTTLPPNEYPFFRDFILGILAGVVGLIPSLLATTELIGPCAMSWLAPRLYILETLKGML